jgi:hypothetical protein
MGIIADIVEFCTEVGEIIVVGDFFLEPVHFREFDPLMEGDLGLRGLQFEARIPGAAIRTIEAAAERMPRSKMPGHGQRYRAAMPTTTLGSSPTEARPCTRMLRNLKITNC